MIRIVVRSPRFDLLTGVLQRFEPTPPELATTRAWRIPIREHSWPVVRQKAVRTPSALLEVTRIDRQR